MNEKIKLAVFDVDGTLSVGQNAISNNVSQKICGLELNGLQICLASGKDHYYLTALARGMGLSNAWYIAENGAVIQTDHGKECLVESSDIINGMKDIQRKISLAFPLVWFQNNEVAITAFFENDFMANEILMYLKSIQTEYDFDINSFLHAHSFDIVPACVDKAFALRRIKREADIATSQIIAAGDNANDEKMLSEVKYRIVVGAGLPWINEVQRVQSAEQMLDIVESSCQ